MTRRIGIAGSWIIWIGGAAVALTTNVPQWLVVGLFLLGFVPYLLALHLFDRPGGY